MKIWHLKRVDTDEVAYTDLAEIIVVAVNSHDARRLVARERHEGDVWLDEQRVKAQALGDAFPGGGERVVMEALRSAW